MRRRNSLYTTAMDLIFKRVLAEFVDDPVAAPELNQSDLQSGRLKEVLARRLQWKLANRDRPRVSEPARRRCLDPR